MNTRHELAQLIQAARLRIFGCARHGHNIRNGHCIDCVVERIVGRPMTPPHRILAREPAGGWR